MKHSELLITPAQTNNFIDGPIVDNVYNRAQEANSALRLAQSEAAEGAGTVNGVKEAVPVPEIRLAHLPPVSIRQELDEAFADYDQPQYPYLAQTETARQLTIPDRRVRAEQADSEYTDGRTNGELSEHRNMVEIERQRRGELLKALEDPELDFDHAMYQVNEAQDKEDRILYP